MVRCSNWEVSSNKNARFELKQVLLPELDEGAEERWSERLPFPLSDEAWRRVILSEVPGL